MKFRPILASRAIMVLMVLVAISAAHAGVSRKPEIQVALNPGSAKAAGLRHLGPCVAVTPDGAAVVGNAMGLWLVGGGKVRDTGVAALECFTFTPEGLLMGVSSRKLVFLDSSGQLKPLFRLPGVGMSLVPGNGDSLLLFGREDKGTWALYTIRPGRKVSLLLRSPKPITAAAETSSHILVVIDGALFLVEHGELRLLAGEPKGTLTAVAADPDGKAIFVSDDRRIFRVNNRRLTVVADGFGGTLRWQRGGLLVFDPRRPLLVRLVRVE